MMPPPINATLGKLFISTSSISIVIIKISKDETNR
jgi:hypothetical protein